MSNEKQKERRFNDEQIRNLEAVFESETKLEPGKKMKLAKQLGLQPRQIAIWFQNKRARWKSKTVEKDYGLLLADYKNLSSKFDALKEEKQSLLFQLQKLKNETVGKFEENLCQSQIQETAPRNTGIDFLAKSTPSKYMEGIVTDDDHSSSVEKVDPLGFEEVEAYQFLNSARAEVVSCGTVCLESSYEKVTQCAYTCRVVRVFPCRQIGIPMETGIKALLTDSKLLPLICECTLDQTTRKCRDLSCFRKR